MSATENPDVPAPTAPFTPLTRLADLIREHGTPPTLRHVLPSDEETRLPVCAFGSSI